MKKIIFDTDIGGDCDDVLALDVLLSAYRAGECELLGVTYCAKAHNAPACIYAICRQHGFKNIPIGRVPITEKDMYNQDVYATVLAEEFPYAEAPRYDTAYDAVKLLRKLLAENENVTLVVTGYLTNIAALLKTEPDEYSDMTGIELVRNRVSEIAAMAGAFCHINGINPPKDCITEDGTLLPHPEWNIKLDIPAAQFVFDNAPCPIVLSPYEVGMGMLTGKPMREHGEGKVPDSMAYTVHGSINGRDSWDPATAMYGVYGAKPLFYLTSPGKVTVRDDGVTDFTVGNGKHRIMECAMERGEIAKAIDDQVMRLFAE